ncbi:MAG TPA: hypothetical protein VKW09_05185 [bacterium]|nr:hypothetical protein [bacterium]
MPRPISAVATVGAVLMAGAFCPPAPVQAADQTAAVVLFYATTPVTTYSGVVPEEYASAGMSTRLTAASAGRLTVVPRDQVRAQEQGLRWRESDVLRFGRLEELAHAAGAGRLVVGWIRQLIIDHLGGGAGDLDVGGGEGGGLTVGDAVMEIQVFDAAQGRITYQTEVAGHATGAITMRVVQDTLDDTVGRAVAQIVGALTAAPAVPVP